MADQRKSKEVNKFAILVHQLQKEDKDNALSNFSKESIEKVLLSPNGLCVFFKHYNSVIQSILRRKIEVNGLFYEIYPMVTNLTVRGIGPYATNSIIEDAMKCYGFIIDSYRIQEVEQRGEATTVNLTDDYRIVLDVPEVFANFNLTPVRLPKITLKTFEVSFFCRFCRHNGHMQFQCPSVTKKSSSSSVMRLHSLEFSRRTSCENSSSNLSINQNKITTCSQSRFHKNRQCSKIHPDYTVETEKEQNHFSDQKYYFKNEPHQNDSHNMKNFDRNSFSNSKRFHNEHRIEKNKNIRKQAWQNRFSSNPANGGEEFRKDYYPSTSKKLSTENSERRRSYEKKDFHQHCDKKQIFDSIQASSSYEYCNEGASTSGSKRKKETIKFVKLLSKLLPLDADLKETAKIIKTALKTDVKDLPPEVETGLRNILEYNREFGDEFVDGSGRILKWIKTTLKNIKHEKLQRKKLHKDTKRKKDEQFKDGKSAAEIPTKQVLKRSNVTLSLGMKQAVEKTPGVLKPEFLCNFLNQARNRRNLLEVTHAFTKDIPNLASQLSEVLNSYYKYVIKKGPEENRDISYIKKLRLRLLKQHGINTKRFREDEVDMAEKSDLTRTHEETESIMAEVSVKKESEATELSVKTESDMTEVSVKTETDVIEASVKREDGITEVPVKYEAEIFMRQTSDEVGFTQSSFFSNNRYDASYFTNITQMPVSLIPIKTEVNDMY